MSEFQKGGVVSGPRRIVIGPNGIGPVDLVPGVRRAPTPKETLLDNVLNKAKAVAAAVGVLVTLAIAATGDKAISFDEASGLWAALAAVLTVLGVYRVPNKPA